MADEVITGSLGNSVDELNHKYREDYERSLKEAEVAPEPAPESVPEPVEDEEKPT